MLNLIDRWVVAVRQAKAEADAIVAEGRQIMHWPKPLSWREGWARWRRQIQGVSQDSTCSDSTC
ncbi:MAG: hypothetical protein RLZZ511_3239 [Cyanobacteriota bacterium]|jgi:hypothetical protein